MKATGWISIAVVGIALVGGIAYAKPWEMRLTELNNKEVHVSKTEDGKPTAIDAPKPKIDPADIRSLYTPAFIFADKDKRAALIKTAKASNANALVIDVKDTTGVVMPDELGSWVAEVREAGLIPIARVVCFQDNEWAKKHPEYALQNPDGSLWIHKGLYWLDPAAPQNAERVRDISLRAADLGFLEINLDYVRFPTDGAVDAIRFPVYQKGTDRAPVIAKTLATIRAGIKEKHPDVILSADLYAYSFILTNDVGIGQKITTIGPSLDVIAPMIYPSHYGTGNFGFKNPAEHPYEVTDGTLAKGIAMLETLPKEQQPIVRPWIQAFNLGADYTPDMIKASRQAVIDNTGYDSWMAWNATATYDPRGLAAPITAHPKPKPAATSTTSTAQ